jgi:hypothetical protein
VNRELSHLSEIVFEFHDDMSSSYLYLPYFEIIRDCTIANKKVAIESLKAPEGFTRSVYDYKDLDFL